MSNTHRPGLFQRRESTLLGLGTDLQSEDLLLPISLTCELVSAGLLNWLRESILATGC